MTYSPATRQTVIAHRFGFTSLPRFSRAFRAAYGTSPRDWRAAACAVTPTGHPHAYKA
ncbi:helix-turn-helix domain-containing protein [Streptomyces fulvorobeus]|uniref:helix-turn-helix domain-containing protein n=1 Tax=Streptomyces fulvorobeus TaxID=284028 RepID=UPI0015C9BD52|nr:helix-turn-helix domain-containing protein [Streptomyces fulvorobeus]